MEAWKNALVCVVCGGLFIAGIPLPVAAQQAVPEQNVSSALEASSTVNHANEANGSEGKIADGKITEVGTAVAEAPPSSGIAASQPAGVAIAPAKQRRVRTIVLRMGAIVGAGVAVGSVVALTAATSSKPPGAH